MNRRELLKLTAGAAAGWAAQSAGLVLPKPPVDYRAFLRPFCSTNPRRYMLAKPFGVAGGYLAASDGKVIVRIRESGAVPHETINAAALPWDGPWGEPFGIEPFPEVPEKMACYMCQDFPAVERSAECICGGAGVVPNDELAAMPWAHAHYRWFRAEPLQRILRLPGVCFRLPLPPNTEWVNLGGDSLPAKPMRFDWDGGDGLIMPLVDMNYFRPAITLVRKEVTA